MNRNRNYLQLEGRVSCRGMSRDRQRQRWCRGKGRGRSWGAGGTLCRGCWASSRPSGWCTWRCPARIAQSQRPVLRITMWSNNTQIIIIINGRFYKKNSTGSDENVLCRVEEDPELFGDQGPCNLSVSHSGVHLSLCFCFVLILFLFLRY